MRIDAWFPPLDWFLCQRCNGASLRLAGRSILPSKFPFHELPNVVMTPHMSGWTTGTINRLKRTIADNIGCRADGRPCLNVMRPARTRVAGAIGTGALISLWQP